MREIRSSARSAIQTCPSEAPDVLGKRWESPPGDSVALRVFAGVTSHVRDARLANAVISAVRDRSLVPDARLAALGVLVTYYKPSLFADFPIPSSATRVLANSSESDVPTIP
jgi:hypothetical protein